MGEVGVYTAGGFSCAFPALGLPKSFAPVISGVVSFAFFRFKKKKITPPTKRAKPPTPPTTPPTIGATFDRETSVPGDVGVIEEPGELELELELKLELEEREDVELLVELGVGVRVDVEERGVVD